MILSPSTPVTVTVARVSASGNTVSVSFREHHDGFRTIVHSLGYSWFDPARAWLRSLNPDTNGAPHDRAAELTAQLIKAGISVDVDQAIADAVQSASWKPEHRRWVLAFDGAFGLRWRGQDDNLYRLSLMLPGAHWSGENKAIMIAPLYYNEVEGFAEAHGFQFSPTSVGLLERARTDYQRAVLPDVPMPTPAPAPKRRSRHCDPVKFADIPERNLRTLTDLLPHQIPAVAKILPMRVGALFMDMGTGKTRCAIELAARRQARTSKVVWFCPVNLKPTIAAEIAKHAAGETVYVFDDVTSDGSTPSAYWYIVGIESMSSSDRVVLAVNSLIDSDSFVIVDESTYIKGHASKRSMRIAEIGKRARYRLLLTGTPLTQGIEDLYAQMRFLSPDILGYGSFYSFARNHLEYSEKYPGLITRAHNVDNLAEKIAPYVYQVTKAECLDLPEKLYDQVFCNLTEKQHDAYAQAKEEILLDAEELDSYIIFKLFTALQQIVSGFWHRDGEMIEYPHHRLETLQMALAGIQETEKVIVWCKFVHSVRQIADALPGSALYYGDLTELARSASLDRFRSSDCRYLIATQATGGHGLTLNEACFHAFYENGFKYGERIQAEDRSHRIGQTRPVTYIDVYSNSGIDIRIRDAIAKKQNVLASFRREVKRIKDVREKI